MKKFRFTLASLLSVKLSMEKQLKGELAEAEARIRLFNEQLHAIQRRLEKAREAHAQKIRAGLRARDMERQNIGFAAIYEKIEAQREKIRVAEEERGRIRHQLVEVMRERKMLEKLREKQYEAYLEEAKKEEAARMDDFLTSKLHGEER